MCLFVLEMFVTVSCFRSLQLRQTILAGFMAGVRLPTPFVGHRGSVFCVAVTVPADRPDRLVLAYGSNDSTIRVWDVATCADDPTPSHLLWASRGTVQLLDAHGLRLAAATGLREHQQRLLRQWGWRE